MQPLLENSHNPLVRLNTNPLLTKLEFMNHTFPTLWTHPKDKRMVVVLPARRGFQQMVPTHRVIDPTLPRDVKVIKHQMERAKLSTQLGRMHLRIGLNPNQAKWRT